MDQRTLVEIILTMFIVGSTVLSWRLWKADRRRSAAVCFVGVAALGSWIVWRWQIPYA